jgi:uncharacterized RDD family membrane protein YckC
VIFFLCSLLTGVEASAAQNLPVTKTCSQCGGVLPSSVLVCNFCDSSSIADSSSSFEETSSFRTRGNLAMRVDRSSAVAHDKDRSAVAQDRGRSVVAHDVDRQDALWRGEITQRLQDYRARRRKLAPNHAQSQLAFEEPAADPSSRRSVAIAESPQRHREASRTRGTAEEEFSFTIAIGRPAPKREREDTRMVIDVSIPPNADPAAPECPAPQVATSQVGLYPVASIDERRIAALLDAGCLLFAFGGFLALFGSVAGQLTFSKLSAAVYFATFAFVYLQYFGVFTIFGGTTPGMMFRGLQVVNFNGDTPAPRQLLLRAAGYMLSAGTLFLGFLWAMWDEDALTWHDRLSHTYLCSAETLADMEVHSVAPSR